jgi:hypothetical protein
MLCVFGTPDTRETVSLLQSVQNHGYITDPPAPKAGAFGRDARPSSTLKACPIPRP